MGLNVTGNDILDRVEQTLLDETNARWARAELEAHLNAALAALVTVKADAYTLNKQFSCVAGSKQTLTGGDHQILEVVRNDAASKRAITLVERSHLDATDPDWHTATPTSVCEHWCADKRDPKHFYLYPPPVNAHVVEVIVASTPVITDFANPIPVDDLYENPLWACTLAFAYAKNAKRGDLIKSSGYFSLFTQMLGGKAREQLVNAPTHQDQTPAGQAVKEPA